MSEKVRVGVVGTSPFAENTHLAPLASHPGAEIAAICGRNPARAGEVAAKYGIPRVFTDWRELAALPDLDAVCVVTPDNLHYPVTMAALEAGKHVFCEKALAMNQAQAFEMYETAERLGRVHMTMFTFRWNPAALYMRRLVEQGYVGQVYQAQFSYLLSLGRSHYFHWRNDPEQSNGMVADLGAHLIDQARCLCGDVARAAGRVEIYEPYAGAQGAALPSTNDSAVGLLEFTGGAQATLQLSSVAHLGTEIQTLQLRVCGSDGTLEATFHSPEGGEVLGAQGTGKPMQELPIPVEFVQPLLSAPVGERLFIDAIRGDARAEPTFYDGWKAQQVIDALVEGSRTGKWENIR
jgi:predicted dehydrogenase